MKRVAFLTLVTFIISGSAFAQEDNKREPLGMDHKEMEKLSPEEKAEKRTAKMKEGLGLSDEQAAKIEQINLDFATEMDKIHEQMKALKDKAHEMREKTKGEIESVLTDEQKEKFEKKVEEHKKEREQKRKERCCEDK